MAFIYTIRASLFLHFCSLFSNQSILKIRERSLQCRETSGMPLHSSACLRNLNAFEIFRGNPFPRKEIRLDRCIFITEFLKLESLNID